MTALETWFDLLDGPHEPDRETCVAAANLLLPAFVFVNPYEYRDRLVAHLRTNPQAKHEDRLRAVLKLHADDNHAALTIHPDVLDDVDTIDWDAVPEVMCLAAVAALYKNKPADAKEAWVANGDAARPYLTAVLDEVDSPSHNLARVLLQQGDRLHVSGGLA